MVSLVISHFGFEGGTLVLIALVVAYLITKTRLCNILQYFKAVKMIIFRRIFFISFLFLLKTLIVGTRSNRLSEAVLTSCYTLCLGQK